MSWKDTEGHVHLTWRDVEELVDRLISSLHGKTFDVYLIIALGGLIPGGLIAKWLNHKRLMVACITLYNEDEQRLEHPLVLEFPAEPLLTGQEVLIVDDVWHTGRTIALVRKMVSRAGGFPSVATLHYKPQQSEVEGAPDYYVDAVEDWIVYPWEERDHPELTFRPEQGMRVRIRSAYLTQIRSCVGRDLGSIVFTVQEVTDEGVTIADNLDRILQIHGGQDRIFPTHWLEPA